MATSIFKGVFTDWIKERILRRNEKVAIQRDIMISVDPDIADAFNQSTSVSRKLIALFTLWSYLFLLIFLFFSVAKGVGYQMLRVGQKRRRTRCEIDEEKEQARLKQEEIEQKLQ